MRVKLSNFALKTKEMAVNREELRNERQWRACIGVNKAQFHRLSSMVGEAYEELHGITITEQISSYSEDVFFKSYEDIVFFTLFSLKSGLSYDVLGFCFNVSGSTAFNNQVIGVRFLQMALQQNDHLPHRCFEHADDLRNKLEEYDELLIDATEQRRQRPANQEEQKNNYSGKKKRIR